MQIIGILGFGVVGKSFLRFLANCKDDLFLNDTITIQADSCVYIWDQRDLRDAEKTLLHEHNATHVNRSVSIKQFLQDCDIVCTSAGFDLTAYKEFDHKIVGELDLFSLFSKNLTVALTGTLGKTTVTKLLGTVLGQVAFSDFDKNARVFVGGNIGKGLLDNVQELENYDVSVLELSSFQLERNNLCAPDVALFTNFYPNHLDRHADLQEYFDAKWRIFEHQHSHQVAVLPLSLLKLEESISVKKRIKQLKSSVIFFDDGAGKDLAYRLIEDYRLIETKDDNLYSVIVKGQEVLQEKRLFACSHLSNVTFHDNWLMVFAVLCALDAQFKVLEHDVVSGNVSFDLHEHHHRMEFVGNYNNVSFYNDSKATVIQATRVAAQTLSKNNGSIIVILGGLSKGVDRSILINELRQLHSIKEIVCFGNDCQSFGFEQSFATLHDVFNYILKISAPGDCILFSPGGSSFDLFKNYKERGEKFKELVLQKAASLY